jgi:hypothetical protein
MVGGELAFEDAGVEEDDGVGGLVLARGAEPAADDEVGEEITDLGTAELGGRAPALSGA